MGVFSSNCVIVLVAPELSLKTNVVRRYMEKKLWENMRAYIRKAEVEITDFHFVAGRVLINTKTPHKLIASLAHCFGIHTMFEAQRFPISSSQDIVEFTQGIAQYVHGTFAVRGRSLTKKFSSMGLEKECGSAILSVAPQLKVKLVNPDSEVFVLSFDKEAIVYFKGTPGAGGMPVGSQGIAALLFNEKKKEACYALGKKLLQCGCRLLLLSDDKKCKGLVELDEWNAYKEVKVISIDEAKSRYAEDRIAAFFSIANTLEQAHKDSELLGVKVFAPLLIEEATQLETTPQKRASIEIKVKDAKNIGVTGEYHSYFRCFYDIPFTEEIESWAHGKEVFESTFGVKSAEQRGIIPVFEARYKGTSIVVDALLQKHKIKKVLSIAAGMEQRGIEIVSTHSSVEYIETDISDQFVKKEVFLDELFKKNKLAHRSLLHTKIVDVRELGQIELALSTFSTKGPLIIVNEGLLAYYTKEEMLPILHNIQTILKKHGGYWVTPDPSLNKENRKVLFAPIEGFKKVEEAVHKKTGRAYDERGFISSADAKDFFTKEGFSIVTYGQEELGYTLNSLSQVGLSKENQRLVADAIQKCVQVWVLTVAAPSKK